MPYQHLNSSRDPKNLLVEQDQRRGPSEGTRQEELFFDTLKFYIATFVLPEGCDVQYCGIHRGLLIENINRRKKNLARCA